MLIDQVKKQIIVRQSDRTHVNGFLLLMFLLLAFGHNSNAYAKKLIKVVSVIDGDTVVLLGGQKVRFLGINTPEIGYRGKPSEAGAVTAKEYLKTLVLHKKVYIERDIEREDHYGRTLAYIFLEDGLNINLALVRRGVATLSLHPPNLKYAKSLQFAQHQAEESRLGLWALEAYQAKKVELIADKKLTTWGRFYARVQKVSHSKKGSKLWLNTTTYVWISVANKRYFPELARYKGRRVEIRGWPRKRGKNWSISAIHSSQLLIKP
ncbi:MAG: thermonuclease family protein [Cycloclasticus sp.]